MTPSRAVCQAWSGEKALVAESPPVVLPYAALNQRASCTSQTTTLCVV